MKITPDSAKGPRSTYASQLAKSALAHMNKQYPKFEGNLLTIEKASKKEGLELSPQNTDNIVLQVPKHSAKIA